jgi:hypothetical protein
VIDQAKTTGVATGEPQLPAFRFGLKHLFWSFTAASLLLAALVVAAQAGNMTPVAMLLGVLAVVLHVGGTAIGLRMRQHANERRAWEAARTFDGAPSDGPVVSSTGMLSLSSSSRPRSPLHIHDRPVRRLRLCVAAGAIVGGCLGVAVLSLLVGGRTSVGGIVVGAVSMAVVGAWLAFVGTSSWSIFRQGWRDAVDAAGPEKGLDA